MEYELRWQYTPDLLGGTWAQIPVPVKKNKLELTTEELAMISGTIQYMADNIVSDEKDTMYGTMNKINAYLGISRK